MRFTPVFSAAVMAGAASAQSFRITAQVYNGVPGEIYESRTWYADGNLYVGPIVPQSVQTSANFTRKHLCPPHNPPMLTRAVLDWTATLPRVVIDALPPAAEFPAGTFMAINNSTGATDPVVFTNDASSLGSGWITRFLRYGTYLIPQAPSGSTPTDRHYYLEPTEQSNTFIVTWRTPGTPSEGLQNVSLLARL
ncbi:hypothetical protein B0I35DRAFT_110207 [Stachybotrys elegans]|uniref:Uncharacterized protein n=1 Tax=Stachybotrys elegans TaxID=80388 RepID=A0A8K0WMC6_9HYPO|nr:hypothetical protein B0I35DRAFT_110207 [Stachybotrys elegans]